MDGREADSFCDLWGVDVGSVSLKVSEEAWRPRRIFLDSIE